MKPRIGVYLSEGMAARLAEAATRPGATKSALVETALDRLLGSDEDPSDNATLARQFAVISGQLEQLDHNLKIANETVALHARFHLAVTPLFPAAAQEAACALGAERFEEFAAQVERRVDRGVPSFGKRSPGPTRRGRLPLKTISRRRISPRPLPAMATTTIGMKERGRSRNNPHNLCADPNKRCRQISSQTGR